MMGKVASKLGGKKSKTKRLIKSITQHSAAINCISTCKLNTKILFPNRSQSEEEDLEPIAGCSAVEPPIREKEPFESGNDITPSSEEDLFGSEKKFETLDDKATGSADSSDDPGHVVTLLATGSDDSSIRLYGPAPSQVDYEEYTCLHVFKGHSGYVTCMVFWDEYLISGSADTTIRKWDMSLRSSDRCVYVIRGHDAHVERVMCTGCLIFSTSYDRTARIWDFETGDPLRIFLGHRRAVTSLIFIPHDANYVDETDPNSAKDVLITGSLDGTARSWDIHNTYNLNIFLGHSGAVTCMATDLIAKHLFTGSIDNTVRMWNISNASVLRVFKGHTKAVICIQVVNKMMYTGSSDHTGRAWVTEFGDCTRVYKGHKHTVSVVKVKDGLVFTACGDGFARCYDAKSGSLKREFKGNMSSVSALQNSSLNLCVTVMGRHCIVLSFFLSSLFLLCMYLVYTGSGDATVKQYDSKTASLRRVFSCDSESAVSTLEVVDGRLFTGCYDGCLRVWDATGIQEESTFGKEENKNKEVKENGQPQGGNPDTQVDSNQNNNKIMIE